MKPNNRILSYQLPELLFCHPCWKENEQPSAVTTSGLLGWRMCVGDSPRTLPAGSVRLARPQKPGLSIAAGTGPSSSGKTCPPMCPPPIPGLSALPRALPDTLAVWLRPRGLGLRPSTKVGTRTCRGGRWGGVEGCEGAGEAWGVRRVGCRVQGAGCGVQRAGCGVRHEL